MSGIFGILVSEIGNNFTQEKCMSEIKVHVIPGMGRQGDVLILPSLQPFAEADLGGPYVALYPLANAGKYSVTSFTDGVRALRLTTRCFLRHEEHAYQSFPPGDYVVIQQHVGDEIQELRRAAD